MREIAKDPESLENTAVEPESKLSEVDELGTEDEAAEELRENL